MKTLRWITLLCLAALPASGEGFRADKLAAMDAAIEAAITNHQCPGGVLWLEHDGSTYHKAFGDRALIPEREAMTEDTIFDAASLTKVIATAPAVMLLVERGMVELNAPLRTYIPEFTGGGRERIKVRELLTHTSGLPPDLETKSGWQGQAEAIRKACEVPLDSVPGTQFQYSDINFILLGEIVSRVTKTPLEKFVRHEIFQPLKMLDTTFLPPPEERPRIAPTEVVNGRPWRGVVHDPTARHMGGVAGHAGLFTTAPDLARYARMLLHLGELDGVRVFKPETVKLMTSVQSAPEIKARRGLGWDIDSPYSGPRGEIFPVGSYGHTGWTGGSLWVDPQSKTFVIFLSNRNHPTEAGKVQSLRRRLGTLAAEAVGLQPSASGQKPTQAEVTRCDVCVFGATSAGVAAAVQAAREGRKVVLTEFGRHVGGMTAGGLGETDIGNKAAIGGLAREFYQRVGRHYGTNEAWRFEPSVAERVFHEMLDAAGVAVFYHQRLVAVEKENGSLKNITMEGGAVFQAGVFIDASYEGDLLAKAGVSNFVGREANSTYHETLDGIRAVTPKHQFTVAVDPYIRPGEPASGLLPLVQDLAFGEAGAGDNSVQAYNFRLCLTQSATNKLAIAAPPSYDPARYELLARYVEALKAAGSDIHLADFMHIQPIPGGKTDVNNNGGFSTDFIGGNFDYPEGSYSARERVWQAHEDYTRGLLYFLATSARLPPSLRAEMQSWGLCRDEFTDTGGWPHQLYIREARRMISDYVMTENNCRYSLQVPDPAGLAAYTMDSHNCRRIVRGGRVENEGDVQVGGFPPYPISYRSIVPKKAECLNLFVPVCLSASHIAYGSIRMEPVFMVLGQTSAIAAGLALEQKVPVQEISYEELRRRLLAAGQVLSWPDRRSPPRP